MRFERRRSNGGGCVVEVGAGRATTSRGLGGRVSGIALDSSRYAARRAARAGLERWSATCGASFPVRDGVAAAVLCVFAPRNAAEMRRMLAPGGVIVVVTPTPRHLVGAGRAARAGAGRRAQAGAARGGARASRSASARSRRSCSSAARRRRRADRRWARARITWTRERDRPAGGGDAVSARSGVRATTRR